MRLHITSNGSSLRAGLSLPPWGGHCNKVLFSTTLAPMARETALEVPVFKSTLDRFSETLGFYLAKGRQSENSIGTLAAKVFGIDDSAIGNQLKLRFFAHIIEEHQLLNLYAEYERLFIAWKKWN